MTIFPRPHHLVSATALLLLAACGGGDDGGINNTVAGVTSASAATPKYSQDLIITLQGRNLDKPITATPSGNIFTGFACATLTRSTAAPFASSADTAYYRCTKPRLGANTVSFVRPSDAVELANVAFTVPVPQVTLTVSNGTGVNGNIVITLEPAKVPVTVNNFLAYVASGFYVDTAFHRLVPGFIVQGGGYAKPLVPGTTPLPVLKGGLSAPIALEDSAGLLNLQGTVAMARTGVPDSATSQFFFNLADNAGLDAIGTQQRGYAVFGTITAGTDTVTAITTAPCAAWPAFLAGDAASACVPNPNVVITAAVQTR